MSKVRICAGERLETVTAKKGEFLLVTLRRAGFTISAPCGGQGKCGKCRVRMDGREVLACRTPVSGDTEIVIEEQAGGIILGGNEKTKPTAGKKLGMALDLGTTTLALSVFDLENGECLIRKAAWNRQAGYGADVISRMQFCMENPDGTRELSTVVHEQVEEMLAQAGISCRVTDSFTAGNTVMEHLWMGIDPSSIASAPFLPKTLFEDAEGIAPCVAGYVGGDITAGLLASGLYDRSGKWLFLDIGTNGEMAIGGRDGFVCCAAASGPAFEGAGISCGMTATDGAISHAVWEKGRLKTEVIGGGEPKGICGSGLLDLAALLCRAGVITATGLLLPPEEVPGDYASRMGTDEDGNGIFYLSEDRQVYLSARDVRQLQLAKAAIAAGIQVLMQKNGVEADKLEGLCIAGGFGNYMDVRSAAAIGMLPEVLADRCEVVGNASLQGAELLLLQPEERKRIRALCKACRYVELSGDPDFSEAFMNQMYFYEEE